MAYAALCEVISHSDVPKILLCYGKKKTENKFSVPILKTLNTEYVSKNFPYICMQ